MRYLIYSWGNGGFLEVTRLADGATMFLQGADASAFARETADGRHLDSICDCMADLFQGGA